MITAEIVKPADVDAVWPLISKRIGECMDRFGSDVSAGDLWTMCRAGHVFLIVAINGEEIKGAAIWRYETWIDGIVLRNLITVGEDMATWMNKMQASAKDLALSGGATSYVTEGRPGWGRIFKDAKVYKTLYRMEV